MNDEVTDIVYERNNALVYRKIFSKVGQVHAFNWWCLGHKEHFIAIKITYTYPPTNTTYSGWTYINQFAIYSIQADILECEGPCEGFSVCIKCKDIFHQNCKVGMTNKTLHSIVMSILHNTYWFSVIKDIEENGKTTKTFTVWCDECLLSPIVGDYYSCHKEESGCDFDVCMDCYNQGFCVDPRGHKLKKQHPQTSSNELNINNKEYIDKDYPEIEEWVNETEYTLIHKDIANMSIFLNGRLPQNHYLKTEILKKEWSYQYTDYQIFGFFS